MSLRPKYPQCVGPNAMPTGAVASVFQAPERLAVHRWTFSNTTAGVLAVTLHRVSASETAMVDNQIIPATPVPGNDVIIVAAPIILEAGERVFALAAGAVNLTFIVNDRETEVL